METNKRLLEIEKQAMEVTGDWKIDLDTYTHSSGLEMHLVYDEDDGNPETNRIALVFEKPKRNISVENASFICSAKSDIQFLCQELRKCLSRAKTLEQRLQESEYRRREAERLMNEK